MKKKSELFDYLIKGKMEDFQVDFKPETWHSLAQKLDAEQIGTPSAAHQTIDELILSKVKDAQKQRSPMHWELLAERLDQEMDARQKVLTYKLMEGIVLLLLLLFVSPYITSSAKYEPPIAENTPSYYKTDAGNSNLLENCKEDIVVRVEKITNNVRKKSNLDNKHQEITILHHTVLTPNQTTIVEKKPDQNIYSISPQLPDKPFQAQHSAMPFNIASTDLRNNSIEDLQRSVVPSPWDLMEALDGIMMSELKYKESEEDYSMLTKSVKKHPNLIISMFGSGDYNHIITPSKVENEDYFEGVNRFAPGYGGGIAAGLELGRWELNTGAIYTSKQYQPRIVLYASGNLQDGYYIEGIKNIQLNTLNIPLHLRYNFIHHNKWRVYGTAGLSLQVAFQADYYIADQEAFKSILKSQNLPPLPQKITSRGNDPLDQSNLPKGFLEGGSLWENGYITANVGVGLERYITGRWSIFAQPTYHYSLDYFTRGLGPDKDKIQTMSFFTGVRVRLNQ